MHDEVYELLAGKNVYLDTAYVLFDITEDTFFKILEKHDENKILFASDSPWRSVKDTLELFKSYRLPKATEEKILYKNALALLGNSVLRK